MSRPTNQQQQNEALLNYLSGKLDDAQAQQLEEQLLDDPFAEEASQGLEQLGKDTAIQQKVYALNKELSAKLQKPGARRRKGNFFNSQLPWQILAVIIVIALCTLGAYLITEYLKHLRQ